MTDYYSQNGEDFILDQMFPGKIDGFFVEVGCIDGKRFSNTFHFERKGWKGVCIEAHPDYIPLLQANRPNSIICHCAVGDTDQEDVIFYANKRGSLSTLDKSQEARWQRDYAPYFHGFEEKHVPMKSLGSVFRENALTHIDIFSIDIEGYETHALKGLDFSFIKPLVMVIESDSAAQESEIDSILLPQGYMKSVRVSGNIFFVLDPVYHQRVAGKVFTDVEIVHTRHPLDSGGDQSQLITITTRSEMPQYVERKSVFQRLIGTFEKIFPKVPKNQSEPKRPTPATTRFIFHKVGFHGDQHLLSIVDSLSQHVDAFVETGTNVGSTLAYFAQTYPHIPCLSCEPDLEAFRLAQQNISGLANVTLYNQTSQQFLVTLREKHSGIFSKTPLFWLDAHGYGFQWPLKEELTFITENFPQALVLIDDFKVPGREMFGYDEYEGQVCSFDHIKDSLNPAGSYKVYYPNYTEHTSPHHPLRGWGLIALGVVPDLEFPEHLVTRKT